MAKVKEIILKSASEKQLATYKGIPIGYKLISSRIYTGQKGLAWHILSAKRKKSTTKDTLPNQVFLQNWRKESIPDQQKLKEIITTKLVLQEMLKGPF